MKTKNSIGFPSQGELIKFIYTAAGVLPRKYVSNDEIDEKGKKTIQKALGRLAAEEGNLNNNFAESTKNLSYFVSSHISNQKIIFLIGEVLFDVLDVYTQVLREDGTYLSKKETMKWFLSNYLILRVVLSVNKHLLRFNVAAENLCFPDNNWFLPSIHNDQVEYPLAKTMRWAYDLCETSHRQFHYPDKSDSALFERQEQNLESALNWMDGEHLPAISSLISNFNFSFDILEKCEDKNFRKNIPEDKRESIRIALFIARASTFIFKQILDNYGLDYLKEVCDQYRSYSSYLSEEIMPIKGDIQTYIASQQLAQDEIDAVWYELIPTYFSQISDKQISFAKEIEDYVLSRNVTTAIETAIVNDLVKHHGSWTIIPIIDFINRQNSRSIPESFPDFLHKGLALKDNAQVIEDQIRKFEEKLKQNGVDIYLPWILDWIYGAFHYRNEQYQIAYPFFKKAFEAAKYCAGKNQYNLVNQYVEVAAKNNKWTDFKKGIEWAQFLGIEIRWLREKEPTEENLEFVFYMMRTANYAAL